MKVLVIFGALMATTAAISFDDLVQEEWNTYKITFNKKYGSKEEEEGRLQVFAENRLEIAKHNARYAQGEVTYSQDVNAFTDMTYDEFDEVMNGFNRTAGLATADPGQGAAIPRSTFSPSEASVPDQIDWRDRGAVTPVKNQGLCGSCYAFSATGSLEGQTFLKKGHLVSLSEQNLVDCSQAFGNMGCSGGLMDYCFEYIASNTSGLDTESSYPYRAVEGQCKYNATNAAAPVTGLVDLPSGDEDALKNAVATVGPISVSMDATINLMKYKKGIFFDDTCTSYSLDHGVLVVGYGTDNSSGQAIDYWLVKNSWGAHWGEDGYFRLARNRNNMCGIASGASYPTV